MWIRATLTIWASPILEWPLSFLWIKPKSLTFQRSPQTLFSYSFIKKSQAGNLTKENNSNKHLNTESERGVNSRNTGISEYSGIINNSK